MIYETKGLTLEQVDELYGVVGKAWKSKKFRPALHFAEVDETARGQSLAEIAAQQERKRSVVQTEGDGVNTTAGAEKI